jgi:hypothetical protein
MIYVCPKKDRAVQKPCEPCICGMDTLEVFRKAANDDPRLLPEGSDYTLSD